LKLPLDEMFSPLIAAELRLPGHDVVAIKERDEWQSLSDPGIVALARAEQRVVVTANLRDFRPLHVELVAAGGKGHARWCSFRRASGSPEPPPARSSPRSRAARRVSRRRGSGER
jgi:Domain of unknown function (DUF5615)